MAVIAQPPRPRRTATSRATSSRTLAPATRGYYLMLAGAVGLFLVGVVHLHADPARTASGSPATSPPIFWSVFITTFVFWVGIGHAGTLISAILFLFRSPLAHRGVPRHRGDDGVRRHDGRALPDHPHRPAVDLLLAAARTRTSGTSGPTSSRRWCGTCSPSARTSRCRRCSCIFGLIPDVAAVRDKATGWRKQVYALLSLNWQGTDNQWRHYSRRLPVPRRPRDAAGALGALGRVLGLRELADSRLARHHLRPVLRGRRHLLRRRHGAHAAHSAAEAPQARAHDRATITSTTCRS